MCVCVPPATHRGELGEALLVRLEERVLVEDVPPKGRLSLGLLSLLLRLARRGLRRLEEVRVVGGEAPRLCV